MYIISPSGKRSNLDGHCVTPGIGISATVSAEVVVSSIGRLSHHRMTSENETDAQWHARWSYTGRTMTISLKKWP